MFVEAVSSEILPDRRICVTWSNGRKSRFHFVWLRQQYFHPATGRPDQGPDDPLRIPDDPLTLQAETCGIENGSLVVRWANDNALTSHDVQWLWRNAYDRETRLERKTRLKTWTGREASAFPWYDWQTVLDDESALFEMQKAVRDYGFVRLSGAPADDNEVVRLASKFGVLRNTDFGAVADIVSRPPEKAGRYVNLGAGGYVRLAPHTDEGWRYAPPGVVFHLSLESSAASGGESQLCDGFLAAQRLRSSDPEAFDFLSRVPMRFAAERNERERYYAMGRMIVTDQDGDIIGVKYSDRTLGVQCLDEELIEPGYRALRAFAIELYADDLVYSRKLQSGECHVFDNHRVLHARSAFDPSSGPRRLQNCSVDREEFHNSFRMLAERLGRIEDASVIFPNGALG